MGLHDCEDHFGSVGYRLVPWLSWEEWDFVREALFSSSSVSISIALNRIIAWQSRGCLPVSVEVTAAITDIQQKDPFFRNGLLAEVALSEEALRMAYSMAITRVINGVMDQSGRRPKQSISDSAEEIGIPRLLVDIRHEASHNQLPSLPLLRLASKKVIMWLKSNYWERQKNVFPYIRPEIRSRLFMFALNKKRKQSTVAAGLEGEMQSLKKQNRRNFKRLLKFCTAHPEDVVSVLLDECLLKSINTTDKCELSFSNTPLEDNVLDDFKSTQHITESWKSVLRAICQRNPEIRIILIKAILEKIIGIEASEFEQGKVCSLKNLEVPSELKAFSGIKNPLLEELVSWVTWLLKDLDLLMKSDTRVREVTDVHTSFWSGPDRKEFLQHLLSECLQSLAYSCALSEVVLIIARLIGNKSVIPRIEYIVNLQKFDTERQYCAEDSLDQNSTYNYVGHELMHDKDDIETKVDNIDLVDQDTELCSIGKYKCLTNGDKREFWNTISRQNVSLERAKQQIESLKSCHAKSINCTVSENGFHERILEEELFYQEGPWSIAKSWKPCAIGMLPALSNSRGVVPVLERAQTELGRGKVHVDGRQELQQHVQFNQVCGASECMSPSMTHDARIEENGPRNLNTHSEQTATHDKVMRGDDKHVDAKPECKTSAENYGDGYHQQNVKKLRREQQNELAGGNISPRSSKLRKFNSHSAMQGQLLADGVFKPCGSKELNAIQSAVHIFESFRS